MSLETLDEHYNECLRLARETTSPEQRTLLLQMAQSWKLLAEKSATIRELFAHAEPKGHA